MYAYNKSNVAYDLSRFDVEEREKKTKNAPHIKMHATSVAKSGNWFVTIVLVTFAWHSFLSAARRLFPR